MGRLLLDLARSLARRVAPPDLWAIMDDELQEEIAHRAQEGGPSGWAWAVRQYLSLASRLSLERIRGGRDLRLNDQTIQRMRGGEGMEILRDVRFGARSFLREPVGPGVIMATLAVVVIASATILNVAYGTFLRPLPYSNGPALTLVYSGYDNDVDSRYALSALGVQALGEQTNIVRSYAAWELAEGLLFQDGRSARLRVARTTASLFTMLGLPPEHGRYFSATEEASANAAVGVLSHQLWVRGFGRDPNMVGRSVDIDGSAIRIIGIAPPDFRMPLTADLWLPLHIDPAMYDARRWGSESLSGIVELQPGVTAEESATAFSRDLAERVPGRVEMNGQRVNTVPLRRALLGDASAIVRILLVAALLLSLMGGVNVSILLLGRFEARKADFAVRAALGASRGRMVRLAAVESMMMAVTGLAGGVVGLFFLLGVVRGVLPESLRFLRLGAFGVGPIAYGAAVSVVIICVGLVVATSVIPRSDQSVLSLGVRGAGKGTRSSIRRGLLTAQLALASALLIAVGVTGKAVHTLANQDAGFEAEGRVWASVDLGLGLDRPARVALFDRIIERAVAFPSLGGVGLISQLPLSGVGWSQSYERLDLPEDARPNSGGNLRFVSPSYFGTLGIEVLEGRGIRASDGASDPLVVVLDRTAARSGWGDESPLGAEVLLPLFDPDVATVVGVVEDVSDLGLGQPSSGHMYVSHQQRVGRAMIVVATRKGGGTGEALGALRQSIEEADPRIAITEIASLNEYVSSSISQPRLGLAALGAFGGTALLLSLIGIYGVFSYSVARRGPELGIRQALGATAGAAGILVAKEVAIVWTLAMALGLGLALALVRVLEGVAIEADAVDPVVYAGVATVMAFITALGSAAPLRRVLRLDVAEVMRRE